MRTIYHFILILAMMFPLGVFAQKDTLGLEDAIAWAEQYSRSQRLAKLDAERLDLDMQMLKAGLKPQLSFTAQLPNYFKSSFPVTQPNGSIAFQPVSQNNATLQLDASKTLLNTNTTFFARVSMQRFDDFAGDFHSYNTVPFRVGVIQPLRQFNSLKWRKKILELEREIAMDNIRQNKKEIALNTTLSFFRLLRAQVEMQIAMSNEENNDKLFTIAKEKYALGKISKSDLLQLELQVNSAKQNIKNAEREVIAANAELKLTMNHEIVNDRILNLEIPSEIMGIEKFSPEELAEKAWQNRIERKQFQQLLMEAEMAMDRAKKEFGWQASIQASIGYTGNANQFSEILMQPQSEVIAQVSVTVPILDGGQRKYAIQRAKLDQEFAREESGFREAEFKQNVRQVILRFNQLKDEIQLAQKSYDIAIQRYDIANQSYLLGEMSVTDLNLAFAERDQAWRGYILLLSAYWINYYTIAQLTNTDL